MLIAEVIPSLGWLDAIPASPVRLKKLRNHASVDAEFQGVLFETYIVVGNHYQGFLSTQSFNIYGIFVDYGTDSNTPRGNSGDLGDGFVNHRKRRRWFSRKYLILFL